MIYGEKFDPLYLVYGRRIRGIICRFRIDPIPYCSGSGIGNKKWFYSYHKKPKSTNEKRQFYKYGREYVRGMRSPYNLPNTYNDVLRSDIRTRRSWKNKKINKQYQKNVRNL